MKKWIFTILISALMLYCAGCTGSVNIYRNIHEIDDTLKCNYQLVIKSGLVPIPEIDFPYENIVITSGLVNMYKWDVPYNNKEAAKSNENNRAFDGMK